MIGLLVRYRSTVIAGTCHRGRLGTAKVGVSVSHETATVRWLEDGATLSYLVRVEVVAATRRWRRQQIGLLVRYRSTQIGLEMSTWCSWTHTSRCGPRPRQNS